MTRPDSEKQDSSEKDSKADNTGQQDKSAKPVNRGTTFGAPGTEKRG